MMICFRRFPLTLLFAFTLFFYFTPDSRSNSQIFEGGKGIAVTGLANVKRNFDRNDYSFAVADQAGTVGSEDRTSQLFAAGIRRAGFDYVRMVTNPLPLTGSPTARTKAIKKIIDLVKIFRTAHLGVIVDVHYWSPSSDSAESVLNDSVKRSALLVAEVDLAASLSSLSGVALELLNEPPNCSVELGSGWQQTQLQLVRSIRKRFKLLPIIVSGCGGQVDGLLDLNPREYKSDNNIIFSFHFYEPFVFTHQDTYYALKDVKFPNDTPEILTKSKDETVVRHLTSNSPPDAAIVLSHYMNGLGSISTIERRYEMLTNWCDRYSISPSRIILGEFGTTMQFGEDTIRMRSDYIRWVSVVRRMTESSGFKWVYWPGRFDFDSKSQWIISDIQHALMPAGQ